MFVFIYCVHNSLRESLNNHIDILNGVLWWNLENIYNPPASWEICHIIELPSVARGSGDKLYGSRKECVLLHKSPHGWLMTFPGGTGKDPSTQKSECVCDLLRLMTTSANVRWNLAAGWKAPWHHSVRDSLISLQGLKKKLSGQVKPPEDTKNRMPLVYYSTDPSLLPPSDPLQAYS